MAKNMGVSTGMARNLYRRVVNLRIRHAGLARARYFGSYADCQHLFRTAGITERTKSIEVMVHPIMNEAGDVVDGTSGVEMREVGRWLSHIALEKESAGHHR